MYQQPLNGKSEQAIMNKQSNARIQAHGKVHRYWQLWTLATLLVAGTVQAQLTELGGTSASGAASTALFLGGVTADEGDTHGSSFGFNEVVDVVAEIRVEAEHVNTVGNVYVVVAADGVFFMGLESGAFEVWDQNPANLLPLRSGQTFPQSLTVPIIEDIAFGPAGVSDTTLQLFLAYDTTAAAGELYYSPAPLTFTIAAEQSKPASLTLYQQTIAGPIIQSRCVNCHVPGGAATGSQLIYQVGTGASVQQANYNTLVEYISSGGANTLVGKPSGSQAHGGGVQLSPGSSQLQAWTDFVNQVASEIP